MRCCCGYLSGARCRLFEYGPADVTASQNPISLASFKSRLVVPFWYRLIQLSWKRGHLMGVFGVCRYCDVFLCPLLHFDSNKEVILACYTSTYGLGAVISDRMEDGAERPIAVASLSMFHVERQYSQLDKEGLALIFGVRKFHRYLLGKHLVVLLLHPCNGFFSTTTWVSWYQKG